MICKGSFKPNHPHKDREKKIFYHVRLPHHSFNKLESLEFKARWLEP